MFIEHIIYSSALAVLVGMVAMHYTGRDQSWIIILMAFLPDVDYIASIGYNYFNSTLISNMFIHGDFHNIAGLVILSLIAAVILSKMGIRLRDAFFYTAIGFGAHLLLDYIVHPPFNRYLFPFSMERLGIGTSSYTANLIVANSDVLIVAIILLLVATSIRMWFEGNGWTFGKYINNGLDFGKVAINRLTE
jgi:hypothetical protein